MRYFLFTLGLPVLPLLAVLQATGTILTVDEFYEDYYGEEPPFSVDGTWLGLFEDGDSAWIEATELAWDSASDDPSSTYYSLAAGPHPPVLLVSGVPRITVGPAERAGPWPYDLSSAEPVFDFVVGGTSYRLTLRSAASPDCGGVVTISDGETTQELYSTDDGPFACDEPHFKVHWAGDLDRDGRLDLVTTFSSKYSHHPRRLWLSSAAESGGLLLSVALFDRLAA